MPVLRSAVAVAVISLTVAAAGCGVGPGEGSEGTASLRVTRDHGAELIAEATETDPSASETVVRFLDREADIETSYGGNFVDSIDGISSEVEGGRSFDWYFYVNGYWSPVGAGEAEVHAGDSIWWDYRDWTDSYRVPAVVGSWPQPFRDGFNGEAYPTALVCFPSGERSGACDRTEDALAGAGAELTVEEPGAEVDAAHTLRVLVGAWDEVRSDRTARTLEQGQQASGVFGRPQPCGSGRWAFEALDAQGEPVGGSEAAAWVATVQRGDDQPAWLVSASSQGELEAAAAMLDEETLRDAYAVAAFEGGDPVHLPPAGGVPAGTTMECR